MPTSAVVANTPRYVLLNGNCRIGPKVVASRSSAACSPIYGFSAADAYEKFRLQSELGLTPYPLVKVYLRMRVDDAGEDLALVVIDAAGPREPLVYAATIEAVLEAHENGTTHVTTEYELMFDQDLNAYQVHEAFA